MRFLDRLESRFGHFAVPGLIRYIVAFNAFVYVLIVLNPNYGDFLSLDRNAILHGQVWRVFTYIFIPRFGGLFPSVFGVLFYLMYLWWIGTGLEAALGSFRMTVYYFTGVIGITAAALIFGGSYGAGMLNTSMLFAFAQFYPDEMIYVMFILPMKIKWMAWISGAGLLLLALSSHSIALIASLVVALGNYFLFFGHEIIHGAQLRQRVAVRRRQYDAAKMPDSATLHDCAVCHRTEATNPDLEFRVSRDGNEYCIEHLPKPAL